ncbi:aminotransferase class I/II-fold pyridoxal phosphate-dependent enzyme, partial [Cyanobium sp. HWJ4-Hawea]|uniref:aminotransferase class I/II-fold pyridoxal phosphate-dependent enzyme n=1 Tax=Cyanobium sp. HWJ4-Hawea TaxID=2823713 RepID=UPI0020CE213E
MAAAPLMEPHGGNRASVARRLGCRPDQLLDASASLVPFGLPLVDRFQLLRSTLGSPLRDYPDRSYSGFAAAAAALHGVQKASVLVGNGAAELFTWAARDAAAAGSSWLPEPGFADYRRALATWQAKVQSVPLPAHWSAAFPQAFAAAAAVSEGALWLTNPHNPTGQLWGRESLEPWLERQSLVICDEAFLPLVPNGEAQSLIPLV